MAAPEDGQISQPLEEMQVEEKPERPPRLHLLDWMRAFMIGFAVFAHVWQVLRKIPDVVIDNTHMPDYTVSGLDANWSDPVAATLNQDWNPEWKNDISWRYVQVGRQLGIPVLFFINGIAFSYGKGLMPAFQKIALLTLVGCASNGIIWILGPGDERCGWLDRDEINALNPAEPACDQGWWLDFVVAPRAGVLFGVIYQFWFTLFICVFIVEAGMMMTALRSLNTRALASSGRVSPTDVEWAQLGGSLAVTGAVLIGFSFWAPEGASPLTGSLLGVGMEAVFMLLLTVACCLPKTMPVECRVCQYLAAFASMIQFCAIDYKVDTMIPVVVLDGRMVTYFHIFKHFMMLGYTMAQCSTKVKPVASRLAPVVWLGMVMCTPGSNWFLSGVLTYPYMPRMIDRFLWTGGSYIFVISMDRMCRLLAVNDMLLPCPAFINMGGLLSFVLHPWGIVIMTQLPVVARLGDTVASLLIIALFVLIAAGITGGK